MRLVKKYKKLIQLSPVSSWLVLLTNGNGVILKGNFINLSYFRAVTALIQGACRVSIKAGIILFNSCVSCEFLVFKKFLHMDHQHQTGSILFPYFSNVYIEVLLKHLNMYPLWTSPLMEVQHEGYLILQWCCDADLVLSCSDMKTDDTCTDVFCDIFYTVHLWVLTVIWTRSSLSPHNMKKNTKIIDYKYFYYNERNKWVAG